MTNHDTLVVTLPMELSNRLQSLAAEYELKRTKLVRQMIDHCLREIENRPLVALGITKRGDPFHTEEDDYPAEEA